MLDATVVVPTETNTLCTLPYLYKGLISQTNKNFELVMVLKPSDHSIIKQTKDSLACLPFKTKLIVQQYGGFANALNVGKANAGGKIIIYTDADAIPFKEWIANYVNLFEVSPEIGAISSKDIYIQLSIQKKIYNLIDRGSAGRIIRRIASRTSRLPQKGLAQYQQGVYIDRCFGVQIGSYIPFRSCFSLPYKGVNMSFRRDAIKDLSFLEHSKLKRYPWNEQYFGIQIILNGWMSFFVSDNPVYHIWRGNLSRIYDKGASKKHKLEKMTMRNELKALLENHALDAINLRGFQ